MLWGDMGVGGGQKQRDGASPSHPPPVAAPSHTPCDDPTGHTGRGKCHIWAPARHHGAQLQDPGQVAVTCDLSPVFTQALSKPLRR